MCAPHCRLALRRLLRLVVLRPVQHVPGTTPALCHGMRHWRHALLFAQAVAAHIPGPAVSCHRSSLALLAIAVGSSDAGLPQLRERRHAWPHALAAGRVLRRGRDAGALGARHVRRRRQAPQGLKSAVSQELLRVLRVLQLAMCSATASVEAWNVPPDCAKPHRACVDEQCRRSVHILQQAVHVHQFWNFIVCQMC